MSLTNCRFYEEKYPEIDSFVMVNVKQVSSISVAKAERNLSLTTLQIAEMGAYVKLLEYDNIDGMILLSELSRRRIRSIQKLIRVGRNEVVVVLRVDKEKGMQCARLGCLENTMLTGCLSRIYRSLEATSFARGYRKVRGKV